MRIARLAALLAMLMAAPLAAA
ncbi:MAG: hypothetical protein RIS11_1360, partial [Pseudomonadota bacterium]